MANVLLVGFQAISMYIKNTDFGDLYNSTLFALIYSIDVLLMIILYYSYANLIRINKEQKLKIKENTTNE